MPAFEPAARYAGPRAGMIFTTRDGRTGYYADAAAQSSRLRDDASSSSASSLGGRDAKRRREKRREKKERKREKKKRKKEKKRRKKEKRKRKRSASVLVLVLVLVLLGERRRPLGRLGQADQAQGRQVGRGPRARRRPPRDAALHERRLRALAVSVFCDQE